jgi:hypothetical protein
VSYSDIFVLAVLSLGYILIDCEIEGLAIALGVLDLELKNCKSCISDLYGSLVKSALNHDAYVAVSHLDCSEVKAFLFYKATVRIKLTANKLKSVLVKLDSEVERSYVSILCNSAYVKKDSACITVILNYANLVGYFVVELDSVGSVSRISLDCAFSVKLKLTALCAVSDLVAGNVDLSLSTVGYTVDGVDALSAPSVLSVRLKDSSCVLVTDSADLKLVTILCAILSNNLGFYVVLNNYKTTLNKRIGYKELLDRLILLMSQTAN